AGLPPALIYLVLAVGAATENVFPPIPADTFVLFGAFLSGLGRADPWLVFAATWGANVASALAVYGLAYRFGDAFFASRIGRLLLQPRQLGRIGAFYERWGGAAIFGSRFFPALRALVPVFAGVSRLSFWRTALPMAAASGLWYGAIIYFGATLGRNWGAVLAGFERVSSVLVWVGAALALGVAAWWWRTRHPHGDESRPDGEV
ncbi:MAG TPA: DedA family protein, partial [Longimicrobiales bacterium]|nr:DedA family protein [Longimicrobiales bacterium]